MRCQWGARQFLFEFENKVYVFLSQIKPKFVCSDRHPNSVYHLPMISTKNLFADGKNYSIKFLGFHFVHGNEMLKCIYSFMKWAKVFKPQGKNSLIDGQYLLRSLSEICGFLTGRNRFPLQLHYIKGTQKSCGNKDDSFLVLFGKYLEQHGFVIFLLQSQLNENIWILNNTSECLLNNEVQPCIISLIRYFVYSLLRLYLLSLQKNCLSLTSRPSNTTR